MSRRRPCSDEDVDGYPQSPEVRDLTMQQAIVARLLVQEIVHRMPRNADDWENLDADGVEAGTARPKPLKSDFWAVHGRTNTDGGPSPIGTVISHLESHFRTHIITRLPFGKEHPEGIPIEDMRSFARRTFLHPLVDAVKVFAPLTAAGLEAAIVRWEQEGRDRKNTDLWGKSTFDWMHHCLPFMHTERAMVSGGVYAPPTVSAIDGRSRGDHFICALARTGGSEEEARSKGAFDPGQHHHRPVEAGIHAVIMPNGEAYGLIIEDLTDKSHDGHKRVVGLKKPDGAIVTFAFVWERHFTNSYSGRSTSNVWATIRSTRTKAHRRMKEAFSAAASVLARKMQEQEVVA